MAHAFASESVRTDQIKTIINLAHIVDWVGPQEALSRYFGHFHPTWGRCRIQIAIFRHCCC